MPNKTKADIRHNKLTAKAEKAVKEDKMNKNERLVKKANKLNERAGLGKENIAFGMKPAYNFNPGLRKAAKDGKLDNNPKFKAAVEKSGFEMSYKMVNKEGLKMAGNPAYKFHEPGHNEFEVGDLGNLGDEYKQISAINTEPVYETSTSKYTGPLMPNEQWAALSADKKREMNAAVGADEKGDITKNILSGFNTIIKTASIPQPGTPEVKGDAFSNFDARQRERRIMTDTRKSKRAAIKDAANQSRLKHSQDRVVTGEDGKNYTIKALEGKELRKQIRKDKKAGKIKAKATQSAEKVKRLGVLSDQMKKQESQGINTDVGKKGRVTLQEGKEGSSTTGSKLSAIKFKDFVSGKKSGNVTFEMKLPANAMNYFNKKKK
jgi:hypothetical protein